VHSPVRDYFRPNFWPNTPDILPPHLTQGGEPAHIQRMLLAGTLSSNWGVYGPVYEYGFTQPMPNKEEYVDNEKYELKHWDWGRETKIGTYMKALNQIRNENPALQFTHNLRFTDTDSGQLLAFVKQDPDKTNTIFCVTNLDHRWSHSGHVKVPLYDLGLPTDMHYTVHDLLSGNKYQWQGEWNYVNLDPNQLPMHIFRLERADGSPLAGKT
jgi:starch synthase (maltosyl-transferring)